MRIDCNGGAALTICSAFLAIQLRECAVSPDFAIGTIGNACKTGTRRNVGRVRQLSGRSLLEFRLRDQS
jgi:hypothetical protein